jgi:lipocalin
VLGEATPVDASGARYAVEFQGLSSLLPAGSYNILAVGPQYQYALVGDDERRSLWMLSRTQSLDADAYSALAQVALGAGYDVTKLVAVDHSTCPK